MKHYTSTKIVLENKNIPCCPCAFNFKVIKKIQVPVYETKDSISPSGYVLIDEEKLQIPNNATNIKIIKK